MNATPGYSFRYFRTNDRKWVCVLHAHECMAGKRIRKGVAVGKGRRKETARAACIAENQVKVEQSVNEEMK